MDRRGRGISEIENEVPHPPYKECQRHSTKCDNRFLLHFQQLHFTMHDKHYISEADDTHCEDSGIGFREDMGVEGEDHPEVEGGLKGSEEGPAEKYAEFKLAVLDPALVEFRDCEEGCGEKVLIEDAEDDNGEGGEEGVVHGEGPGFVERSAGVAVPVLVEGLSYVEDHFLDTVKTHSRQQIGDGIVPCKK